LFADSFTSDGAVFNAGFPEDEYNFDSPLAALKRDAKGIEGRYCPAVAGTWKIELIFLQTDKDARLTVNGRPAQYEKTENGIVFTGEGGGDSPLLWSLEIL